MKRRARANSVEADLAELSALHEHIRRSNAAVGGLVTEESHARSDNLLLREAGSWRAILRAEERERKAIVGKREKADQRAKPPPMVAAMGELFLKSRERDREIKATVEAERRRERQSRIDRHKRAQQRLMKQMSEARAAEEDRRHEHICVARQQQRSAVEHSKETMHDRRSRSVMSMVEERSERRRRKQHEDDEWRSGVRDRIDADRAASPSPSLFLKLPPLNASSGTGGRGGKRLVQVGDAQLARSLLRNGDADRASPLPLDDNDSVMMLTPTR